MAAGNASPSRETGIAYLGVLMLVAAMGLMLAKASQAWQTRAQREREAELLFVGDQIRAAIVRYRDSGPVTGLYPKTLAELVADGRGAFARHHLRRLYSDPMTGKALWGEVRGAGGGIVGVYSLGMGRPFKQDGFAEPYRGFAGKEAYRDWVFVAVYP
ncbi:type II secretion system protein [Crenobacter cavernae]|uniref:Type II secretion system protein n=1 Tax=Crenobacter cavernae TaxID=2290923 RepID=A0ABY0FEI0_9NEIS|nr:type II secretion system protein [Crenobacter cavernae]RXZ43205.1 type II secretion system protein [Crenobacter cavernae]